MLRLNNNIQAINVNRAMSRNERTTHARMESLSSGLRVSKASTDASGTVISEGFRAQVSGLAQNVRNTEQANDLLRVADGALDVVSDVLVRMRTLAVRSANSDISDEQRSSISAEFNQLRESMNRLAQSTRYNEQILLAGFDAVVEDQSTALSERAVTGVEQVQLTGAVAGTYTFIDSAGDAQITLGDGTVTQTLDMGIILDGDKVGDGTKVKIDFDRLGIQVTLSGLNASGGGAYQTGDLEGKQIKVGQSTGGDFQVGPNDAEADRLALSLPDLRATSNSLNLDKVSINSLETARDAFSPLDKAIQNIASERGKIGAMQNRMGFTLSFSENEIENMTASDSTIRDADVALETSRLTRSQILRNSSQAMLSSAFSTARLSLLLL
jgi:flagellin